MSTLELTDVVVDYERRGGGLVRAVAGASIAVDAGEIVGLVGESGCGKSTLARAAVGLVRVTSGSVRFEDHDVTPLTRHARPAELVRLQLVFQNPYSSLNPRRKVEDIISEGLKIWDVGTPEEQAKKVEDMMLVLADCLLEHVQQSLSDDVVREQLRMYSES